MGPRVSSAALAERLAGMIGPRATIARGVLDQHGQSESYYRALPPDIVVFPETTAEVAEIVKLCAGAGMPIVPFGAGTSLEGNASAVAGGVCIDFARMNKVLTVHDSDMNVVVQPGITRKQLNAELRGTGLFFPIDPGADASIGGMTSTRASGTMAVRYGTMKDNVMALEVVLADGRVIRTGPPRPQIRGRLRSDAAVRRRRRHARRHHRDHAEAASAAAGDLGGGLQLRHPAQRGRYRDRRSSRPAIPVARIELLDDVMMRGINAYAKLGYREAPTLFFEFHGSESAVAEQAELAQAIAAEHGGRGFEWAQGAGGPQPALARPRQHALCRPRPAARRARRHHRCLRADLAARRMPDRDAPRCRRARLHRAHRRPCRRRQFPHADPGRSGQRRRRSTAPRRCRPAWSPAPSRWTAPAPASTASGSARSTISPTSSAKPST